MINVDPRAIISDDVHLSDGVIISPFTNLYGCSLGEKTRIGPFVEIQRGVSIGDSCKVSSHSFICTGVTIGDGVFIGHGVMFINDKYPISTGTSGEMLRDGEWTLLKTVIGNYVSLGSGSIILGGVVIGDHARIGAGAVVTRDVMPYETVIGIPARVLRNEYERKECK